MSAIMNRMALDMMLEMFKEHKKKCKGECTIIFSLVIQNLKEHGYAITKEEWQELV